MKKILKNIIIISIVAFVLQLTWEYFQCSIFYTMDNSDNPFGLMMSATLGDMMMSVILYLLLVFVNNDVDWLFKKWSRHDYIITDLYALFLSFYFEISALHTGRWGYNSEAMPLFPNTNIALVPVIQLLILLPVIFLFSRLILNRIIKT